MTMRAQIHRTVWILAVTTGLAGVSFAGGLVATARRDVNQALQSTIAFVSTRHDPSVDNETDPRRALSAAEIYLMNGDATNPRRLTENSAFDGFPALSPDGTRIVFESNRLLDEGEAFNLSDLFVINTDGTGQTKLGRGSSATWSPDGKKIAFHASASGKGQPIKIDPGAATSDNDIFVLSLADLGRPAKPQNITNSPTMIDDDPDWSPDGRLIVFTRHAVGDDPANSTTAEIYTVDPNGAGTPVRLTNNNEEERAPSWSPDGKRIMFCCRRGGPDFEICTMNADGTGQVQVTNNATGELTPSWSPDATQIVFHRRVGERGHFQLFKINLDGTAEKQLTFPPGLNGFPNWGELRR